MWGDWFTALLLLMCLGAIAHIFVSEARRVGVASRHGPRERKDRR